MERFKKILFANFGTKVISVLIAVVLWFVVLGSRSEEVAKDIPVEMITADNIVVSNDIPEKVTFRFSGPKAFLRTILDRKEKPIKVNLTGAQPGLVTYRFFSDNVKFPLGVEVLSINPTAILLKLEKVQFRRVPVKVQLNGVPPEGYEITKVDVEPASVKLRGARARLKAISEIPTIPIDVTELRHSFQEDAELELSRGVDVADKSTQAPKVTITIQPVSANFKIKNVAVRVLSKHKARLSKKKITVFVRATEEALRDLDQTKIFAQIDLRGKKKGKYPKESVNVSLPEEIGLVKVTPPLVDVTLY